MECENSCETSRLRCLVSEFGQLSRPDGSANFCQGETVIASAVYGPSEVKIQKELDSQANLDVIYKPKVGQSGCAEKLLQHLIKNTCKSAIILTQYPRSNITIILQELQNSGSLLSCCINSACLGLINAGVSMKFLIAAVSCTVDCNGEIIVDPTLLQEKEAQAKMFFAFDSRENSTVSSYTEGIFTQQEYETCTSVCRDASKKIFIFYRNAVARKLSKTD